MVIKRSHLVCSTAGEDNTFKGSDEVSIVSCTTLASQDAGDVELSMKTPGGWVASYALEKNAESLGPVRRKSRFQIAILEIEF
jgi:hypothetical protein